MKPPIQWCPTCPGLLRLDPYTGESGCGNCGTRQMVPTPEPEDVPPILGGQGREPEDVTDDARAFALGIGLLLAVLALVAWCAAGTHAVAR